MEGIAFKVALVGVLGIGAQWLAWRLRWPAIVLMSAAGIIAGPVLGLINPEQDFEGLLQPLIGLAVALILFEGGLNLKLEELRGLSGVVRRVVLVGAPVAWVLGALAGHYVAGLSWPVALLFGGIMVVTGPTVIMPLLRQGRLAPRPAALLKWEAIVNDPIGALFAVLVFETVHALAVGHSMGFAILQIVFGATVALGIGGVAGWALGYIFRYGLVPEYLKVSVLIAAILACFQGANWVTEETGLISVTVMGYVLANTRVASFNDIRRFKENITVLLVSGVFVLLTATLTPEVVARLDWRAVAFVVMLLLIVRPLTILLATLGTDLSLKEKLFVSWIAPRGVVAVAVSGLFATPLIREGYSDAALLVPLSFAVVFTTVIAHGFTLRLVARWLGLVSTERPGVLIVGASPWSVALADTLKGLEIPVLIADTNHSRLRQARLHNVPTFRGEVLSEGAEHRIDLNRFEVLIAATDNEAYNALVCTSFGPEFGRQNVFQIGRSEEREEADVKARGLPASIGGRTLFRSGADYETLVRRIREGWEFHVTSLTQEYDFEAYQANRPDGSELLLSVDEDGEIQFSTVRVRLAPEAGERLVTFGPPRRERTPDREQAREAAAERKARSEAREPSATPA